MSDIIKKKRGRKPKNLCIKSDTSEIKEDINTEEEIVICHIPISIEEITNDCSNLFIKEDKTKQKEKKIDIKPITTEEEITIIQETDTVRPICNNVNRIITHPLKFTKNTKCWWCRSIFTTPAVQLPEDYYNETFYCIGNFCSFNCVKSYNLDINDVLVWEREALINLFYYMTYKEYKNILPAPHWMTLEDFGGILSIDKFRKNFTTNSIDYTILHPPLISRQMQIEESYKLTKLKEVPIDKVNKIYSEINSETDLTMKRNKPIQSSSLNLETTMGLIKKKK